MHADRFYPRGGRGHNFGPVQLTFVYHAAHHLVWQGEGDEDLASVGVLCNAIAAMSEAGDCEGFFAHAEPPSGLRKPPDWRFHSEA